ncbi:MAG: Uncharacterised protein [Formosa sp. Hel1_33_131]|jgi:hypothetical protein|nr:MAG: Uncharacterised protein [Formosa sp. Hel1_33_131]|tara:strand:- start:6019 stop:6495 length:477 start_codon:yes stop_codon:yes gene_type:complete
MKHRKTITSVAFLLLGLGGLHAQESSTAAGGDATGIGGSSSYTVGQVVYTTNTGTNGSLAQGVHQPYEISTTLGINETTINLELSLYPNPTTNYLTLKVENNTNLSYQLIDLLGKVIANKKVTATSTTIKMEALPKAIYFLKVTRNNQPVKTFKVIKQ